MISLEYHLFLGFPVTSSYQKELNQLASYQREIWIQDHPDYLQQIEYEGITYLGKNLGPLVEVQTLETSAAHIFSLLSRLITNYSYQKDTLILLSLNII